MATSTMKLNIGELLILSDSSTSDLYTAIQNKWDSLPNRAFIATLDCNGRNSFLYGFKTGTGAYGAVIAFGYFDNAIYVQNKNGVFSQSSLISA